MTDQNIDLAALRRLCDAMGGDIDDVKELIEDFVTLAPQMMARMRAALAADDLAACGIEAHSMKSNARDMGAKQLATHAAALEWMCKEGDNDDMRTAVVELEAVLTVALSNLKEVDLASIR